jgi:hypothetical protein
VYKYEKEYIPYKKSHGPLSPTVTLNFILNSCTTKSELSSETIDKIYNQPINLPTSTETQTGPTVGSLNEQFYSSACGKYYIIPSMVMTDPYSEPGVININISQILAKRVPGGILVRGAWDKDEQGVFTSIPDADSFVQLKNSDGAPTPYYRAGSNIYTFQTETGAKKSTQGVSLPIPVSIPGVDVATFVPGISTELSWVAKDKSRVYIDGIFVADLDPQTIMPIPGSSDMFKDKNNIYRLGADQTNPQGIYSVAFYDPKTFEILGNEYSKDKNGVYFKTRKIIGADPSTFTVFTVPKLSPGKGAYVIYSYAKDKNAVYYTTEYTTEIVPDADPETFTPVSDRDVYVYNYGKDKNFVYYQITKIPGVDPKTVIVLFQPKYAQCNSLTGYIKDSAHVFYNESMASGADSSTFEVLGGGYGKDKNGIWEGSKFRSDLPVNYIPDCPGEG